MFRVYHLRLGDAYHSKAHCYPDVCAVHRPSKTNVMRKWPFEVRLMKYGIIERKCPHGVGHTDPDSMDWAHRVYDLRLGEENVEALGIHGCDGCCWGPHG